MKRLLSSSAFVVVTVLASAPAARAEIAVLANGETFKVDARREEAGLVWLSLRGGGEVALPPSHIRGYVPDEVLEEVKAADRTGRKGTDAAIPAELARLADAAARRHGIDPELVRAVVQVESAFQPSAVSLKGAQGLMQLMPATARALGVLNAFDPAANLDGGTRHLRDLLGRYDGDLTRALAAYNAGEGAVARHKGVPPYKETRDYVKKVLRRYDDANDR